MKQFLQIHNTDCNKRTNFRTFLQWENARRGKQREVAVPFLHDFVAIVEGLSFTIAGEQGYNLYITVFVFIV